ncbi:MAG: rod shape-determining protein [Candidatus Riflebacteria bacterium]|nr:rod shape-determining protein [Candidatus Riflebacteria bacterium]
MTIFYLGIDLGTSRTSISTSTGKRMTTRTCVGFPKDLISTKRFGNRPYLLGDDAQDNRLGLNLVWPLESGIITNHPKALESAGLILKHLIAEAIPDKKPEDKIYAAIGVPAQASLNNKKAIIEVTKTFIDKILIVSEPFAVGYSLDRFDETLIVDIGAGTSDLCRIQGSLPTAEDQISITKAGNFLDEVLTNNIQKKYPKVQLSSRIITNLKEKYGYVDGNVDPIMVTLTEAGIPKEYDLTEVIRESCLALTDSICFSVQQLVGSFDPEFQTKLRNNIIVAGGGSRLRGIDFAIEKSLKPYGGGRVTCVQDAEFCGCNGCLKMVLEVPESMWEKVS